MKPYYHIYNRGAHKAPIFRDGDDYWRMLKLLYIANNSRPFEMCRLEGKNVFALERENTLVNIVAYCLMPNHIHIILQERNHDQDVRHPENSHMTRFMRKLLTGYSAYINAKYDHSGTSWQGKYKSKVVYDESYMRTLIDYIHMNPYAIKEPEMTKEARAEHLEEAIAYSKNYEYSSFKDYLGENRKQTPILCGDVGHPDSGGCRTSPNRTSPNEHPVHLDYSR